MASDEVSAIVSVNGVARLVTLSSCFCMMARVELTRIGGETTPRNARVK